MAASGIARGPDYRQFNYLIFIIYYRRPAVRGAARRGGDAAADKAI
jgi:hypothetical protein